MLAPITLLLTFPSITVLFPLLLLFVHVYLVYQFRSTTLPVKTLMVSLCSPARNHCELRLPARLSPARTAYQRVCSFRGIRLRENRNANATTRADCYRTPNDAGRCGTAGSRDPVVHWPTPGQT